MATINTRLEKLEEEINPPPGPLWAITSPRGQVFIGSERFESLLEAEQTYPGRRIVIVKNLSDIELYSQL